MVSTEIQTTTAPLEMSLNTTGIEGQFSIHQLEMNIIFNIEGFINVIDEVKGLILEVDIVLPLPAINITIDLSQRTRYTFFTTIAGETLDGSTECDGYDLYECIVGTPQSPVFSTLTPTPSPTITSYPTPDPLTTECLAESSIECTVNDPFGSTCETLRAPNVTRCSSGGRIAKLQFEVTNNTCRKIESCDDYVMNLYLTRFTSKLLIVKIARFSKEPQTKEILSP